MPSSTSAPEDGRPIQSWLPIGAQVTTHCASSELPLFPFFFLPSFFRFFFSLRRFFSALTNTERSTSYILYRTSTLPTSSYGRLVLRCAQRTAQRCALCMYVLISRNCDRKTLLSPIQPGKQKHQEQEQEQWVLPNYSSGVNAMRCYAMPCHAPCPPLIEHTFSPPPQLVLEESRALCRSA